MGAENRSRFAQLHSQKEQESVTQQAREARHFLQAVAVCKDSFTQENTARMLKFRLGEKGILDFQCMSSFLSKELAKILGQCME